MPLIVVLVEALTENLVFKNGRVSVTLNMLMCEVARPVLILPIVRHLLLVELVGVFKTFRLLGVFVC